MDLVAVTLVNELEEMHNEGVKITFIGDLSRLSSKLQQVIQNSVDKTKNNTGVTLQIALNYGARDEISNAVKNIVKDKIPVDKINCDLISTYLYTANVPDPDLLIRTGGEKRISNYLLWQIAYSEIVVIDDFWPEFGKELLSKCIEEFGKRQRRYGK
jgi:undecaprenyl diphosphate synthase